MFTARRLSFGLLWFFAWRNIVRTALLSVAVYVAYEWLGWESIHIPFLPVATIGTAVAFYVGFKNNSSYERLWEARRIWGGIVNQSRSFATQVLETVRRPGGESRDDGLEEIQADLIYRHIAWVNILGGLPKLS